MTGYRILERNVARWLESSPRLRAWVKDAYHRTNYLCFREAGFASAVHPGVRLLTPSEWLGGPVPPGRGVFFGYYDKSPWSSDMQALLLHRLRDDGCVDILRLDRAAGRCALIGRSSAWNLQQGSMTQWVPGSSGRCVVFNDYVDGRLAARFVTAEGAETTVPWPVQALHPGGGAALALNYRRLARLRAEYGYAIEAANFASDQPLERDGIWRVDLRTGESRLLVTLAELRDHEPRAEMRGSEHKVNHAMYAPDGSRFVFLHRWLGPRGKFSRLYAAEGEHGDLRLLLDDRKVSHYTWLDARRLVVWARAPEEGDRYYVVDATTGARSVLGAGRLDRYGDGHPSVSPDGRWLLTDSYPDRARQQHLVLYALATGERIEVGRFFAPWAFDGAARCDLHPRWSPDGRWISIDSAHTGVRLTWMLDVSALVRAPTPIRQEE